MKRDPRPTDEQIADAIEIISICTPVREIQGGMWFSHNHNTADATFVDYGACRAFAVAARAISYLAAERDTLRKALENCAGCVDAAEAEGLHEVLSECEVGLGNGSDEVGRLIDLVRCRLMYARVYALDALTPPDTDAVQGGQG